VHLVTATTLWLLCLRANCYASVWQLCCYHAVNSGSYLMAHANFLWTGPAHYYGSGPPTPSENPAGHFAFTQSQLEQHLARAQNAQAYFSHPSSAVPSRASSPVLQQNSRGNMAAYARQQHAVQTPGPISAMQQQRRPSTQHMPYQQPQQQHQHQHQQPAPPGSAGGEPDTSSPPTITKITPGDGPYVGGTEVSIYGYNFTNGTQVMFGDKLATTVFYGPQALLATSPPSRPGGVNVTIVSPSGSHSLAGASYQSPPAGGSRQIFTYTDHNPRMMEMALRFMSHQQTGSQMQWNQLASQYANQFMSSNVSRAGIGGQQQGYDGGGGG